MNSQNDSADFQKKKAMFDRFLTMYGRKPVLEALQDTAVECFRLHLADSNKRAPIIDELIKLATAKGGEVVWHDKKALSRISKNSRQDQGVAADIRWQGYQSLTEALELAESSIKPLRLLALDGITNPQNVGMILRSTAAGNIDGVLLPKEANAGITPLTIKASAGALFRAKLIYCDDLKSSLEDFKQRGARIATLSSHAKQSIFEYSINQHTIFVLGNEEKGVSASTEKLSDTQLCIPMNNGVESLNVAVTAALIAFLQ